MSKIKLEVLEGTKTQITAQSGDTIMTDAPKEHGGSGDHMSPTDLLAASLGSCVLTIMGLYAKNIKVDLKGTKAVVIKEQGQAKPGGVGILEVHIYCPQDFEDSIKEKLEKGAKNCPIHHSLIQDIKQTIVFHWGKDLQE